MRWRAKNGTSTEEKFHRSYEIVDNGCWEWVKALHTTGYGLLDPPFRRRDKLLPLLAHRFSWELHNGPTDLCVLHKCDNRKCVNPEHLFLGTRRDNNLDRDKKGRGPRGERNWPAKLKSENIPVIKKMYADGAKQKEIADLFNVSQGAISNVVNNQTWTHIKG